MQTITINVDEHYLEKTLALLQQIPQNKREIFQHTKLDISPMVIQNKNTKWDLIDQKLKNLKTIDSDAGEELSQALTLLGKDMEIGEYKTAREEYLNHKYGQ